MNPVLKPVLLASALLACAGTAVATTTHTAAASPPTADQSGTAAPDPQTERQDILKAMDAASTWGHPDLFGEFAGMKRYAKGEYKSAMKYFLMGARYADKPSQLAIGIMYVNGLGVDKDVATGCAWLDLAAERKYPRFVATYNVNCKGLTPAQRQQMDETLAKLRPEYGDRAAKQRMATTLRLARTERTGSRVGFDFGTEVHSGGGMGFGAGSIGNSATRNCGNEVVYAGGAKLPTKGCVGNDFWAPENWDPDTYFRQRDAQWLGTVTVGEPLKTDTPEAGKAAPANAANPASAATSGH